MESRVLSIFVTMIFVTTRVLCKLKECESGPGSEENTVKCECENQQIMSCLLTAKKANPEIIMYNVQAANFSDAFILEIPDNVKNTQDVPVSISIGHMKDIAELSTFLQEVSKKLNIISLKVSDMPSLDPELLAADLATQSSYSLETTELKNLFDSIDNNTEFDLRKFKPIRQSFEISGISESVPVTMPDPIYTSPDNLTTEIATKINISNVDKLTGLVHVLLKEKQANETVVFTFNGLFPRFYREDPSPNLKVMIDLNLGAKMMLKETFLYSGANISLSWNPANKYLIPPSVVRVEFGTFSNGKDVRLTAPNFPQNFTSLFTEGKCFALKGIPNAEDMCEVCYMHQYQMHRVKDKVEELCENGPNNTKNKTDEMKLCYWQDIQKVPSTLDQFKIDKTWIPENVKKCDNLSEDIEDYLKILNENLKEDTTSGKRWENETIHPVLLLMISYVVFKVFEWVQK